MQCFGQEVIFLTDTQILLRVKWALSCVGMPHGGEAATAGPRSDWVWRWKNITAAASWNWFYRIKQTHQDWSVMKTALSNSLEMWARCMFTLKVTFYISLEARQCSFLQTLILYYHQNLFRHRVINMFKIFSRCSPAFFLLPLNLDFKRLARDLYLKCDCITSRLLRMIRRASLSCLNLSACHQLIQSRRWHLLRLDSFH